MFVGGSRCKALENRGKSLILFLLYSTALQVWITHVFGIVQLEEMTAQKMQLENELQTAHNKRLKVFAERHMSLVSICIKWRNTQACLVPGRGVAWNMCWRQIKTWWASMYSIYACMHVCKSLTHTLRAFCQLWLTLDNGLWKCYHVLVMQSNKRLATSGQIAVIGLAMCLVSAGKLHDISEKLRDHQQHFNCCASR